ncbi:ADP-ribosylglycohydrolase family protein [Streptomyces sp. MS1.AVA.1]|uniref:ADP-ribosylglycohydrolase family protein n=1 Tax=Streptomyces machairae TaxID=3134109 RepID=A0ABU8USG5_9ACTN
MTEPWTSTLVGEAVYRSRVRGCLLGGALGDALGYPIEFSSLERIRSAHGERGVTGLLFAGDSRVALVSDDTQMTLFTVEALIQAHQRERLKGIGGGWALLVRWAYERWLETQRHPGPEQAAPPQSGAPRAA